MVKVNFVSDIHLEFSDFDAPLPEGNDILILAGDITTSARVSWVNKCAERFRHVIYVMGNHDYWKSSYDRIIEKTKNRVASNVHVLENESVTIDGTTFHGATYWTDLNKNDPLTVMDAERFMNDFKKIRLSNYSHRFTAAFWMYKHNESKIYFKNHVKKGDVVIIHHAPSFQSISEKYKTDKLNGCYASADDILFEDLQPSYIFHGHVHHSCDYMIDNTRVLCNPRGYVNYELNPDFNMNAFIEI